MFKTKEELLERAYKVLPYSNQICELDLSQDDSVYFTWRHHRWKIFLTGEVYEIESGCMVGNNNAMLMGELFKKGLYINKIGGTIMFIKIGEKRMKASLINEYSGCKKSSNSEKWYITLNKAKGAIEHVYFNSLEECEAALDKMDEDLKCK